MQVEECLQTAYSHLQMQRWSSCCLPFALQIAISLFPSPSRSPLSLSVCACVCVCLLLMFLSSFLVFSFLSARSSPLSFSNRQSSFPFLFFHFSFSPSCSNSFPFLAFFRLSFSPSFSPSLPPSFLALRSSVSVDLLPSSSPALLSLLYPPV